MIYSSPYGSKKRMESDIVYKKEVKRGENRKKVKKITEKFVYVKK